MIVETLTFIPKHDTEENWKIINPIIKKDELVCVLTKRGKIKWKIGNGESHFKELRYVNKISDILKFITYCESPIRKLEVTSLLDPFNK